MATIDKETLDDKDRGLLLLVTLGLSYDIRIFGERLRQEIDRLVRSGVSQQSIISVINQDFQSNGRIFGELKNAINRGLVGGINQAFRRNGNLGKKLKWIAVSKNICPDCKKRAGEVDSWEGWEVRGMPGSGWSICKEYCYCQLMPEKLNIDDILKI